MAAKLTASSVLISRNNTHIPVIGLGTLQVLYKTESGKEIKVETIIDQAGNLPPGYKLTDFSHEKGIPRKEVILRALDIGYRHLDTAFAYENEAAIGDAIKEWIDQGKVKREDLFITTKLPNIAMHEDKVAEYLQKSLDNLKLKQVDLYLIQNPVGYIENEKKELYPRDVNGRILIEKNTDHTKIWKAMANQITAGKTKAIGMCNFTIAQMEKIIKETNISPANVQAECHLYFQQQDLRKWAKDRGIIFTAYACLGSPAIMKLFQVARKNDSVRMKNPIEDPVVERIAIAHKKTKPQVLIRHLLQLGVAVIPKSSDVKHLYENINAFDFELTDDEMAELNSLDLGERGRKFSLVGFFQGYEQHPLNPYPSE